MKDQLCQYFNKLKKNSHNLKQREGKIKLFVIKKNRNLLDQYFYLLSDIIKKTKVNFKYNFKNFLEGYEKICSILNQIYLEKVLLNLFRPFKFLNGLCKCSEKNQSKKIYEQKLLFFHKLSIKLIPI